MNLIELTTEEIQETEGGCVVCKAVRAVADYFGFGGWVDAL